MLRTIFFGTPEFAVPTLDALVEAGIRPLRVVSQPARPVGRGRKMQDPPVARRAHELGLEVRQPETVRDKAFLEELRELAPDVAVVVAFGQIFRRALLELPRHGCVNLHASLLPKYRGAAPIQAAIATGETVTGVCTMRMERGLDSGPVLLCREVEIGPRETTPELAPRLARVGAELTVETLRRLAGGGLVPQPQDHAAATHAPQLSKADAVVDWRLEASAIHNRLRAYTPWPGIESELGGQPLKIRAARPLAAAPAGLAADLSKGARPGVLLGISNGLLAVRCGNDTILGLERVQRPGRKEVSAVDLWNGERLETGEGFRATSEAAPEAAPQV